MNDQLRKAVAGVCGVAAGVLAVKQVRKKVKGTAGTVLSALAFEVAFNVVTQVVDGLLARREVGSA